MKKPNPERDARVAAAQALLDEGLLVSAVARHLVMQENTLRTWVAKGLLVPRQKFAPAFVGLPGTPTCPKCGEVKPLAEFIVVGPDVRRGRKSPRIKSCRACHRIGHREFRRKRGLKRPDRMAEDTLARKIATRVLAGDLRRWAAAQVLAARPYSEEQLQARMAERGVSRDGADWSLRYELDPEFRAAQILRVHRRNAYRDHRLALVADGTLTGEAVRRLFAAATTCHYCARPMTGRDKSLDHVTPVSQGGTHSADNVVIACKRCNTAKAGRTPEQWRAGVDVRRVRGSGLRGANATA